MFNQTNGYSLADIATATGRNNDGFLGGENGAWWIIILFLFVFMGGGWNNGWNYNNPNTPYLAQGAADNYVLASDFATLQRQLSDTTQSLERKGDTINSGLCDGFYAQNTTMLNGFNGITQSIADSNYATQNALTQNRIAAMQDNNALTAQITGLGSQMASCCCDQRYETATQFANTNYNVASKFADLNYNIATQDCQTRQRVADSTAELVANQDANTRSILAAIQEMQTQNMQDKIATLTADNQALKFAASQAAQNAYLLNSLQPAPHPAYIVSSPYASYSGCGCNGSTACC